jgi:SPX domain protein involved in polyphosphate accumulation
VTHFFEKAEQEFVIREERVRGGVEIIKGPNSIMVNEKWSTQAKSIYRLYKDLSLLETFAIMTYCSFSKILKKHDKVTGHQTRTAFMSNIVNKVRVGCNVRSFVVLFFGNGSNSIPLCAAKEQSCFVSENCSYDY